MRFDGRVVVVTGGARGIGRATAERFAREGARVVIGDRSGAEVAAREIDGMGIEVDVADAASVGRMVETVVSRLGTVDVLINNAGIVRDASLQKTSDEAWDAVVDVNLKGVFLVGREVARHMVERRRGVIVNGASIVGVYGNFGQSNYAASKAGVIGLTRVWARELGRKGVRVNCVAPGFIATDMTEGMPQAVLDGMVQHTPMGRMGTAADVAAAYAFLASDDAAFVSGQVLGVDGGLVLGT